MGGAGDSGLGALSRLKHGFESRRELHLFKDLREIDEAEFGLGSNLGATSPPPCTGWRAASLQCERLQLAPAGTTLITVPTPAS